MKIANKNISSSVGIIIILIISALIIGGIYFYFNSQTSKSGNSAGSLSQNKSQTSFQTSSTKAAASSVQGSTATWKTYKGTGEVDSLTNYSYEIEYPSTWAYTMIGLTGPIFAPKSVIDSINQAKNLTPGDKSLPVIITVTNKALYNNNILPYRNSNSFLRFSSSQTEVAGFPGTYYLVQHLTTQNGYNVGDKSVTIDVKTNNYYLTLNLADYQYVNIFQKMISTLRIIE